MNESGLDFSAVEESVRIEGLRFILGSPAWQDFFQSALENALTYAHSLLKLEPDNRKPGVSDALLRARIQVLESVLSLGPNLIRDYDEMRVKREQQEAIAEGYAERAADGRMGPPA
jgi:hypothetical protein